MHDFTNKIAVITGGAGGIGGASAAGFAKAGARVYILDLSRDGLDAAFAQIAKAGGTDTRCASWCLRALP